MLGSGWDGRSGSSIHPHPHHRFSGAVARLIGSSQMAPAKGDRRFQHQKFSEPPSSRQHTVYLAAVRFLNAWLDDLKLDKTNTARARF
jgi:hypothetical protein